MPSSNDRRGEEVEPSTVLSAGGGRSLGKQSGDSVKTGSLHYDAGVYEGGIRDGKRHGRGVFRPANGSGGSFYEGEWADGSRHGRGTAKYSCGGVYEGQWVEGIKHGKGTFKWADDGRVYEGEFANGLVTGWGTMTRPSGELHEGEWAGGIRHGKGTGKLPTGETREGIWVKGEFVKRTLRSQRSQQRRLVAAKKICEYCGVDDYQYKLRVCSGCNVALYCSAACQKAASRSHQRICSIVSELPPRDADRLALKYDRGKMVDLDAGLRYAAKYMDYLKHLEIDIRGMASNDAIKLSGKQLSSLLRSKKGALSSFSWETKAWNYYDEWGNELHGLKHLRLVNMYCDEAQHIQDVLSRQTSTLMVLILPQLQIDWHRAKCRRTIALAVASCKSLVKLQLDGCVLTDADLKVMLQDLPNLRLLHLARHPDDSHEFTDNTCGLIARKCPGLQELDLRNHVHLSVRGVRKIFYGCPHLRAFYTSSLKLRSEDVRSLLDTAPQLMYLSLNERFVAGENLDEIIEATGGRTLIQFNDVSDCQLYEPREGVSAETRETYDRQIELGDEVIRRSHDPDVINEWEHLFEVEQ